MRAEGDTQAGTPNSVVKLAQQFPAFVGCLVVVEAAQQHDGIGKRIGGRQTEVMLVPGVLETAGIN